MRSSYLHRLLVLVMLGVMSSCTSFFYQPTAPRRARLGEETPTTTSLRQLPEAREKIVAAVYKFRDLTGQYKQSETGTGFSTAVTQGTTNILLKAMEESGWFIPIERENVSNLLNERKIVRSSVAQFKDGENLPPLLFAGIILEGGVVSYDANIITGGGGLQYFSAGGSTQYRQDRVTVYLRAVATKTGKILKTIYTSKTILSQTVNASLFRYVTFKRLLEAETGLTTTEPGQMAVTEAIEKAVEGLIIEGVRDGLWVPSDSSAVAMQKVLEAYDTEKSRMTETDVYGMRPEVGAPRLTIQPYSGLMRYSGDYARHTIRGTYGVSADVYFTPNVGIQASGSSGVLASEGAFSNRITTLEGNLLFRLTPYQRWSSLLFAGAGLVTRTGRSPLDWQGNRAVQAQGGVGIQYTPNGVLGFRTTIAYHQPFSDDLDGITAGTRNDYYLRATLGVTLNIGRRMSARTTVTPLRK
ncbi:curli production assembly protein CsgG [Siphonobacter sp. BAB-5385]|uniref:CsgG/HfaB family protein n=1 Tax=Siphonobacter sp. BAB-5385 TaxID=1864822 RepID=UPI000B9E782C|nr:CsgG/HfaB family protein [Siphonobacter sp. BAB-5385]OZI07635.1 curli production assembly protein CsgG [Siphonobacter sp. BAB-5385]